MILSLIAGVFVGAFAVGCAVVPAHPLVTGAGAVTVTKAIMARKDQIIQLSSLETDDRRPVLLLLHGATDDPTEMMDIVNEWRGIYDVYLYAYNCHAPVQKIAADFVGELQRLRAARRWRGGATIVVYSYAAIVFREAVIQTDDRTLFSGASLIQLVPTAGGSFLARGIKNPILAWVVSLASKPAHAEDPYGRFAEQLWAGAGNRKFCEVIPPEQVHTIRLEGDPHSLAGVADRQVQERYHNGIGLNVVTIPKSTGVTHDYFPTNPVALAYLRQLLELPSTEARSGRIEMASLPFPDLLPDEMLPSKSGTGVSLWLK